MSDCRHVTKDGVKAVFLCYGNSGRSVYGLCTLCHEWIYPAEWRSVKRTETICSDGKVAFGPDAVRVRQEHPDYHIVRELEEQCQAARRADNWWTRAMRWLGGDDTW